MDDQPHDPDATIDYVGPTGHANQIAQYRILKQLGRGGFGVVYQAEDIQLHRKAALKVMRSDYAALEDARARFVREAQAAAALKHDHIVTIYQVGDAHGVPFLAMELLAGKSLDEWLRPDRRATVAEAVLIGKQIARGLAAAHAAGLVHRDIKPANLWLEAPRGRVKILDFGLARWAANYSQLTEDGSVLGTPAFMAPEQARGDSVDHRCDLFSFGCVLYRMLTGRLPFQGDSTYAVLMAIASEMPQAAIAIRPEIPQRLSDLVERLLAKNPTDRVQSAQEVLDELIAIEKELKPMPQPPPLLAQAGVGRTPQRWPWWILGLATAVFILPIAIALWARTSSPIAEPKPSEVESGQPVPSPSTPGSVPNSPRLEPLRELNTPGDEFAASPGISVHVLFFTRVSRNQSESGTFRATRQSADVPFGEVEHVVRLRQSVVSHRELIGVAKPKGEGTRLVVSRRVRGKQFDDPVVIGEFSTRSSPRSPWLSADGLTLVFQRSVPRDESGNDSSKWYASSEFVVSTRDSPDDNWSEPVRLPLVDDPLYSEPLNWPALTEDLLTLFFCIGDGKSARVAYATRSSLEQPFANPRAVMVEGKPLLGRSPRYEPLTRELFVARDLSAADTQPNWDLWVVKDFSLTPAAQ